MTQGDLGTLLRDNNKQFGTEQIMQVANGVAAGTKLFQINILGMCYLHKQNPPILHGDLKSSNVLLDRHFNAKVVFLG